MQLKILLAVSALGAVNAAPAPEQVERWTPQGVSSELFESHAAFDPKTGELYFVRSSKKFSGWRILTAHCEAHGWSVPHDAPFAGKGVEADPYFTPDGRGVYFISTRATGSTQSKDLDIWKADRRSDGSWAEPVRLPAPVMFARDAGEPLSGEFFIWRLDGHEAWPPACP